MRMWMVDPKILCRSHLMGEHLEMHMFLGSILKNTSMRGYLDGNLLEPSSLVKRHGELAEEMINRGMNHKSPITIKQQSLIEFFSKCDYDKLVDRQDSLNELLKRCGKCRSNYEQMQKS